MNLIILVGKLKTENYDNSETCTQNAKLHISNISFCMYAIAYMQNCRRLQFFNSWLYAKSDFTYLPIRHQRL